MNHSLYFCIKGADGGESSSTAETMRERLVQDIYDIETVSLENSIASVLAFERMMMSWIRDLLPNTSLSILVSFPLPTSETDLRFPCVAATPCIKLASVISKSVLCSCKETRLDAKSDKYVCLPASSSLGRSQSLLSPFSVLGIQHWRHIGNTAEKQV